MTIIKLAKKRFVIFLATTVLILAPFLSWWFWFLFWLKVVDTLLKFGYKFQKYERLAKRKFHTDQTMRH